MGTCAWEELTLVFINYMIYEQCISNIRKSVIVILILVMSALIILVTYFKTWSVQRWRSSLHNKSKYYVRKRCKNAFFLCQNLIKASVLKQNIKYTFNRWCSSCVAIVSRKKNWHGTLFRQNPLKVSIILNNIWKKPRW